MAETSNTQKIFNITIIILLAGTLLLGILGFVKASKPRDLPSGYPPAPKPGLGDAIAGILSGVFTAFSGNQCDPANPGYTKNGKRNTKCDTTTASKYCDCSRPGYATDGVADINCEPGKMIYDNDCG